MIYRVDQQTGNFVQYDDTKEDLYRMFSTLCGVRLVCFTLVHHDLCVMTTYLSFALHDFVEARCTYTA